MDRKTQTMLELEKRFKKDIRDILIEYYYEKNLTLKEVGEILGVDFSTVSLWLLRFDMPQKRFAAVEVPKREAK